MIECEHEEITQQGKVHVCKDCTMVFEFCETCSIESSMRAVYHADPCQPIKDKTTDIVFCEKCSLEAGGFTVKHAHPPCN